jgi:hypothetical protein
MGGSFWYRTRLPIPEGTFSEPDAEGTRSMLQVYRGDHEDLQERCRGQGQMLLGTPELFESDSEKSSLIR